MYYTVSSYFRYYGIVQYTQTRYNIHIHKEKKMRTNVVLDDDLVNRARELTGLKTKRAVIDEALRTLIRMYEQKGVRELRGKLNWEGDLNEMREGRFASTG